MTGPEHYVKAERLAGQAESIKRRATLEAEREVVPDQSKHLASLAQVHATLALVAATAEPFIADYGAPVGRGWIEAIS